jgi:hypothetical protein
MIIFSNIQKLVKLNKKAYPIFNFQNIRIPENADYFPCLSVNFDIKTMSYLLY